jgi:hypothetical protein
MRIAYPEKQRTILVSNAVYVRTQRMQFLPGHYLIVAGCAGLSQPPCWKRRAAIGAILNWRINDKRLELHNSASKHTILPPIKITNPGFLLPGLAIRATICAAYAYAVGLCLVAYQRKRGTSPAFVCHPMLPMCYNTSY